MNTFAAAQAVNGTKQNNIFLTSAAMTDQQLLKTYKAQLKLKATTHKAYEGYLDQRGNLVNPGFGLSLDRKLKNPLKRFNYCSQKKALPENNTLQCDKDKSNISADTNPPLL